MTKLLALDQASITSGYSIWHDGELKAYGKFTFNDSDIGVRLLNIRNKVLELIQENDINEIIFEDIQLQTNVTNNVQTFKVLAEVFGIIYELATELKISNRAVLAGTWKKHLGIKGRTRPEQKRNAQEYVQNTYGIKATQDECDSICIGAYACANPITASEDFDWS